ncbi:hypothetical protein FPV67DRAFT_1652127 [Lyophyllum atratum]|nr:hypothetical protein FPV67DRAFT_1652127 [Lyophyllum atratum]
MASPCSTAEGWFGGVNDRDKGVSGSYGVMMRWKTEERTSYNEGVVEALMRGAEASTGKVGFGAAQRAAAASARTPEVPGYTNGHIGRDAGEAMVWRGVRLELGFGRGSAGCEFDGAFQGLKLVLAHGVLDLMPMLEISLLVELSRVSYETRCVVDEQRRGTSMISCIGPVYAYAGASIIYMWRGWGGGRKDKGAKEKSEGGDRKYHRERPLKDQLSERFTHIGIKKSEGAELGRKGDLGCSPITNGILRDEKLKWA